MIAMAPMLTKKARETGAVHVSSRKGPKVKPEPPKPKRGADWKRTGGLDMDRRAVREVSGVPAPSRRW